MDGRRRVSRRYGIKGVKWEEQGTRTPNRSSRLRCWIEALV